MTGISGAPSSRPPSPTPPIEANDAEERTPSSLAGLIRSVSQSSDDPLGFTVIRPWTLDRIDRDLARINFSMALSRTIPEGAEQAPDIDEDSEEPINIEADIQVNGNNAHGVGTLTDKCLVLATEMTSNNSPENTSEEGMAQQQQVLDLIQEGLKFSCIGTSWLSFGTNTYLCLNKEVLDEDGSKNAEASTHLVFNNGIYSPLQRSDQERYANMLEECIDSHFDHEVKGKSAALTGLARLYNQGQLKHKIIDPVNLLNQWKLEMMNGEEFEESVTFEWTRSENGTYAVTRNYKGADGEQVSCQSSSCVDVAAVKTQTASSQPPNDKTIYNFLFWDGPDSNSPLSLEEQKGNFYANPPIIISSSDEHILFISQDGKNTFLLRS